ncbi:hypothetical protein TIFTF001_045528 [Ficus carica]|uniref:Uncharacterized protein n=1 Tax=Ficus carica TaxID=3494 RepID=A0AA87YS73_FICCA|nr:hypothetical protein TIFTF001_045528 [Ficus carica]
MGAPLTAIHLRVWRRPWSAPPAPWPGWPPRPSCAHGACEGRGEGPGQGGTSVGHPRSGVARAVVTGGHPNAVFEDFVFLIMVRQAISRLPLVLKSGFTPRGAAMAQLDAFVCPIMNGDRAGWQAPYSSNELSTPHPLVTLGQAGRPGPRASMGRAWDGAKVEAKGVPLTAIHLRVWHRQWSASRPLGQAGRPGPRASMGRARDGAKAEANGVPLTAIHLRVWCRQWAIFLSRIAPRRPSARMVDRLGGLTGETLISAPPAPWPGWPPWPSRAPWACEGRGEGPGQGGTAGGPPPAGGAPAGGGGGGGGFPNAGLFLQAELPVVVIVGLPAWAGEAVMSPGGLCGGGHKVPRTRGYLSKLDSPEKAIRPDG